ncbi:MAG: hypothetical protein KKD29_08175 [Candidatus Omnitrophica bacterium]|nr:hypothetical protein [Candidatus Omnitrophota bacterium]MBU4488277.1 hypothetical protein [Candidatus Omnitrophota bacterium]MCG2704506.1 hypothetical protein [Candidatus Omnitrophota bacterium]
MRFEEYIKEDEISQPRTPKEFNDWFGKKLEITKELREELKTQNILHQGVAKIFYEELFPLYRLLQNKLEEWKDVRFKPIIGCQNYDVRVESKANDIPQYIEITIADRNEIEHARMEYFLSHGHVNMIGDVSIERDKKLGKKVTVDEEACSSEEINQKIKGRIRELIDKKMAVKERLNNTALLVFFDDYTAFRYDIDKSKLEMRTFLDALNIQWQSRYLALYVVGASGKGFWENNSRGNNT